jgi:hypothetical protein
VRNYYREAQLPNLRFIITDKVKGLIEAINQTFFDNPYFLCLWHINNDVETHYRELWKKEINIIKDHITAEEKFTFIKFK